MLTRLQNAVNKVWLRNWKNHRRAHRNFTSSTKGNTQEEPNASTAKEPIQGKPEDHDNDDDNDDHEEGKTEEAKKSKVKKSSSVRVALASQSQVPRP